MIQPIATISASGAVRDQQPLDREAAALFLRAQASWLRRGLRLAEDPVEVGIVLGTHDSSHESWVELIAAVERSAGAPAAGVVSALYGFHGRVVGSLERDMDLRLDAAVQAQVRRMLADRLTEMTEQAVALLAR
ncbi:MAG TPA: hypothetical protein VNU01_07355 [Egibacteraceae bacterium]|nr:hypothetical protein [Egibacteraceae bacterium]